MTWKTKIKQENGKLNHGGKKIYYSGNKYNKSNIIRVIWDCIVATKWP